jgi:hypothetical protein
LIRRSPNVSDRDDMRSKGLSMRRGTIVEY